jgi:hypothetical protein
VTDPARGGHILALLPGLEERLRAPQASQGRDALAPGDDKHAITRRGRANREARISLCQRLARSWPKGWLKALLGRAEVLDEDHDPGLGRPAH